MRLIDADELKKNFQDELCKGIACAECSMQVEGFCRVERWIDIAPTIEAEPTRHGRWLIYNILDYAKRPTGRKVGKCSVCGQLTPDFRLITEEPNWSYCPNCGARMFDNDIDVSDKNVGKIDEVENG